MCENNPVVSIILPVYNEGEVLAPMLNRLFALPEAKDWEVLVVDDGSTDNTAEVAERYPVRLLRHPHNMGNGRSVRTGGLAAKGEILVFLDGDGQHPPEEIPAMLREMESYDMVVAARARDADVSRFRSIGNKVLNRVASFLTKQQIADLTSGFRIMHKSCFEEFQHLFPQRYSYPTTITMAMINAGYFVKYVPIASIKRRETGTSNIQPFRDGLRFLNIILRMVLLFHPTKIFAPLAGLFLLVGLSLAGYTLIRHSQLQESSILMISMGVFVFFFGMLADQIAHMRMELHMLRKDDSKEKRKR